MTNPPDPPGVYVRESGAAPAVIGVSTSTAAFVDFFSRGPMEQPVRISSTEDFDRIFTGLAARSEASYGVRQFFANGGEQAWVVRAGDGEAAAASARIPVALTAEEAATDDGPEQVSWLQVVTVNPGTWGNDLRVTVRPTGNLFSLQVTYDPSFGAPDEERFDALSLFPEAGPGAVETINRESRLINITYAGPEVSGAVPIKTLDQSLAGGSEGGLANKDQLVAAVTTLDSIAPEVFNILCLPTVAAMSDSDAAEVHRRVRDYVNEKRAFYIIDPPARITTAEAMIAWASQLTALQEGADGSRLAIYFPRLGIPDPLDDYQPRVVGPSGTVAGVWARTDRDVGVWKAPAGINAVLQGDLAVPLDDEQTGRLNRRGINSLRSFPEFGTVVWGARTSAADAEWKYVNVRRLVDYIELSVQQALDRARFEENDEKLWTAISAQVDGFLSQLYRQGAFPGARPQDAYFVQCDATTTTEAEIDRGVVVILIGVAPQLPGEFISLRIEQQLESSLA